MHGTLTPEQRVRRVITDHLGLVDLDRKPDFNWDADLIDDLGADSLDRVELCMALEEEFGVQITDDAADEWRTAGDLLKTVEGLL